MKAYKKCVNEETMKIDIVEFDIDNPFDFSHDPVTNLYDSDNSHSLEKEIITYAESLNAKIDRGDYSLMKCKDCNRYFLLPKSEKEWFEERSLAVPKRCPRCRSKRRNITMLIHSLEEQGRSTLI